MKVCKHYPSDELIKTEGPYCDLGLIISKNVSCSIEDENACGWARTWNHLMDNRGSYLIEK